MFGKAFNNLPEKAARDMGGVTVSMSPQIGGRGLRRSRSKAGSYPPSTTRLGFRMSIRRSLLRQS